jgi:hypothetical protein
MATSIRWANTSLGDPLLLPSDFSDIAPGSDSGIVDYYISHTSTSPIYNCKFYLVPYTFGPYLGATSAQDDYDLVIGWGDDSHPATSGGGLYINTDYSNGFPTDSWKVFRSGYGDTLGNAITLPAEAINIGSPVIGQIPAAGEAHIRFRWDVPAAYASTGLIYVAVQMYYSETS